MKATLKFQNIDDVSVNLESVPRIHERLQFYDGTFIVADVVTVLLYLHLRPCISNSSP